MEEDYVNEMLAKWAMTIMDVREQDRVTAAQRLEAAFRRSQGMNGDKSAVQKELNRLKQEGFFDKSSK